MVTEVDAGGNVLSPMAISLTGGQRQTSRAQFGSIWVPKSHGSASVSSSMVDLHNHLFSSLHCQVAQIQRVPPQRSVILFQIGKIDHGHLVERQSSPSVAINDAINDVPLVGVFLISSQEVVHFSESVDIFGRCVEVVFFIGLGQAAVAGKIWWAYLFSLKSFER